MGEPGLGKSRLFYEFKLLSQAGCLVLEAYSVSHGKASPYLPVIELLKSYFRDRAAGRRADATEKIGGKVLMLDRSLEDTLPYLFALLGIEEPPSPLQQMDPQIRRRRTFEALKKLFLRESLNQPLILIFEDLHWIDGETQGFLDVLSESVATAKILLLVNYRPEYRHEWGQKTYYTQLRLAPFGKAEAEEFLEFCWVLETGSLSIGAKGQGEGTRHLQALKQLILEKTEGTPFFMEEMVQELMEQGVLVRDGVGARLPCPYLRIYIFPLPCKACWPHVSTASPRTRKRCCNNWRSSAGNFRWVWSSSDRSIRRRTLSSARLAAAQRVSLRAASVSGSGVHLQACADARSGLRVGATGTAQSVTRTTAQVIEALYRDG